MSNMRYRIRLNNLETGESRYTTWTFSNKKVAIEWAKKWNDLGHPFGANVIDERKKETIF